MRRVIQHSHRILWLGLPPGLPAIRDYEIAPPAEMRRLRRHLLQRIARRIRDLFRNEPNPRHEL